MKKFNPIDWQSFALKKDVEHIAKSLKFLQGVQASAALQLALIVCGIALPKALRLPDEHWVWILIMVASALVLLFPLLKKIIAWKRNGCPSVHMPNVHDFKNAFDNKICYYVYMSESYYKMLLHYLDDATVDKEMKKFYYIEASYYLNKAIAELAPISSISKAVLTNSFKDVVSKKMIAIARYYNVYNMLMLVYGYLSSHEDVLEGLTEKDSIIGANNQYIDILNALDGSIKMAAQVK